MIDNHAGSPRSVPHDPVREKPIWNSARPTILPEDRYRVGRVLHSGSGNAPRLSVHRTTVSGADPEMALTWGGFEACVARLNLSALPASSISQRKRIIDLPPLRAMDVSLRNVRDPCVWPMTHPVDQVCFELPSDAVTAWAERPVTDRMQLFESVSGMTMADDVLAAFGLAALPHFESEAEPGRFFVDHLLDGVCAYLFKTFAPCLVHLRGGLAPWQQRRATEMMAAACGDDIALADLAAVCGLSQAHFSRAFKQTFGTTPYRWLTSLRVERAQTLLRTTDTPLAVIATECGFVDQAHLTNVFRKHLGSPPGALRRYWRGDSHLAS